MAPRVPNMAPRVPNMAPRVPNMAPRVPNMRVPCVGIDLVPNHSQSSRACLAGYGRMHYGWMDRRTDRPTDGRTDRWTDKARRI